MKQRRKPVHPGRVFKLDVLEPLNISVSAAARMLKVSRKHLSNFTNEKVPCTSELAIKLAHATNTTVASWLNMQTKLDIWEAEQTPKKDLKAIEVLYEPVKLAAVG